MASESSVLIDEVVRGWLAPLMKTEGFKKTARNWHADDGVVVKVLNLQGSSWNGPTQARFTINLGVWFDSVAGITGARQVTKRQPTEYQCTVRARIGRLFDPPSDVWWTIESPSDVPVVGESVTDAIREWGLPWLESLTDPRAAIDYLTSTDQVRHSPLTAMALALSLDDVTRAGEIYSAWESENPAVGAKLPDWARNHGFGDEVSA